MSDVPGRRALILDGRADDDRLAVAFTPDSVAQVEEIARTKMPDLTAADMDAAIRTIAGSARSAGIEVEGL